jgi:hypothetical protein
MGTGKPRWWIVPDSCLHRPGFEYRTIKGRKCERRLVVKRGRKRIYVLQPEDEFVREARTP